MNNELQALVVGSSGNGKSEFILSFLDEQQRKLIPASGNGQTTRTSMTYEISSNNGELEVISFLHSSESFAQLRLSTLYSTFSNYESIDDFKKIFISKRQLDNFKKNLIGSDAFFHHQEFECSSDIEKIFNETFNKDFINFIIESDISDFDIFDIAISSDFDKDLSDETIDANNAKLIFEDVLIKFFKKIYNICFDEFKKYCTDLNLKDNTIDISSCVEDTEFLTKFLKTAEGQTSYTSLIKTIHINAKLSRNYNDFFEGQRIEKLTLIDTYGLDHATTLGENTLKNRFNSLLCEDYPDIQSVFYIRNIKSDQPPTDLTTTLPIITKTKPNIVSYLIFTRIDEFENINDYKDQKAYKSNDFEDGIGMALEKNGMSDYLIDNRLKVLKNTKIGYSSILPTNNEEKYNSLLAHNISELSKLFRAIIKKSHLGSSFINIDQLSALPSGICKDEIVNNCTFKGMPSRTIGATKNRFLNGELGFNGTTYYRHWSTLIHYNISSKFSNLSDVISNFSNNSNTLTTLSELLIQSGIEILNCETYDFDVVNNNNIHNIKGILYQNRKSVIAQSGSYPTVTAYLNDVYNFSTAQDDINNYIKDKLDKILIDFSIDYNARCFADSLDNNLKLDEISKMYNDFYNEFYETATNDDKINFEKIVETKKY